MSNTRNTDDHPCQVSIGCATVKQTLAARSQDLGGFGVRRLLPAQYQRAVGPWVFFDHMGPAHFDAGQGIDVRPHPHINLATVTYLFEGEILHRDSLGTVQAIRPGDINLMLAGRGIVHSERERAEVRNRPHGVHGLQLWLALPEASEEAAPAFYHYPNADIPALDCNGVPVRVMIGSAFGATSPVKTFSDTLYLEASLHQGQSLQLPQTSEAAVYLVAGSAQIGDTHIPTHQMAVLNPAAPARLQATSDCRIALVGGQPLGNRHMEWNFVSSRRARIEQAKADWQAGKFDTIPGDDKERIPLP